MASVSDAKLSPDESKTSKDISRNANFDNKVGDVVEFGESYTAGEERDVLRKIDLTILPMMCAVFFLQYLDKQSLSYASVSTPTRYQP